MGKQPISREGLTYHDYMGKFNQYADGLKDYQKGHQKRITVSNHSESKKVPVKVALQELMKAYGQLRKYENPDMPLIKNQLQDVLKNKELKKEYPLRRLLFKIQKAVTSLNARIASMRGKLKIPELKPIEQQPKVSSVFIPLKPNIDLSQPVLSQPKPMEVVTTMPERDSFNPFNKEVFKALEITFDNPEIKHFYLTIEAVPTDQDRVILKVNDVLLQNTYNFEIAFEQNNYVIKDTAGNFVADLGTNFNRENVINRLVNHTEVELVIPPPLPERDLLNSFNRKVFTALGITIDNPEIKHNYLTIVAMPSDQDKVTLKVDDHLLENTYNFEIAFEQNNYVIKDSTGNFAADLGSNFNRENVIDKLVNHIETELETPPLVPERDLFNSFNKEVFKALEITLDNPVFNLHNLIIEVIPFGQDKLTLKVNDHLLQNVYNFEIVFDKNNYVIKNCITREFVAHLGSNFNRENVVNSLINYIDLGLVTPPPLPERDLLNPFKEEVLKALGITIHQPVSKQPDLTILAKPSDQDRVILRVSSHLSLRCYDLEVVFEQDNYMIKDLVTGNFVANLGPSFNGENFVNKLNNYIETDYSESVGIQRLRDRIGLKSESISGQRGRLQYWVKNSNSDPKAVTVMMYDNEEKRKASIRFYVYGPYVDGDQVKAFYVDENGTNQPNPVETIRLNEIKSSSQLLEIAMKHSGLNFKPENLKSNASKLLDKIGKVTPLESAQGYPDVICRIRESESTDAVSIFTYSLTEQGAIFRLYLEGDEVYLKEFSINKETTVASFPLSELSKEKVLDLASKHSGLHKKEFGVGEATVLARMFASVQWSKDQIKVKAIQMGFDPTKKVGDYPPEQIAEFVAYYDAGKNVYYFQNMTIEQLIKKIEDSKEEGLDIKESHAAMSHVLRTFLDSDKVSSEDKELFKVIQERMEEQYDYELNERGFLKEVLAFPFLENKGQELARNRAREILAKADLPKYRTIGPFLKAGWFREGGAHHINVETLRVGDKYHIILSNAGAGVGSSHRPVYEYDGKGNLITTYQEVDEGGVPLKDDRGNPIIKAKNEGIPIKIYETDVTGAEQILTDVLIFNSQRQKPSAYKDFYALFDKATPIEDYRIRPRRLQNIGNCAVKNQEEAYFYICQRLGRTSAANSFLNFLDDELLRVAKHYPALRDDLKEKGKKPPVQPLLEGSSTFILEEKSPIKGIVKHHLPLGSKEEQIFPIGREEMVALTSLHTGVSRRHAVLVQKNGKYYLQRHEKCLPNNTVGCIREGKVHVVEAGEEYEVKKGDVIDLSGYQLTIS